jgi:thiol:disulfide interchange protein DsbC
VKIKKSTTLVLVTVISVLSLVASADELDTIRDTLAGLLPGQPDSIKLSPIPDLYEATYGAEVIYITRDGRYVIRGDVLDLKQKANLTELQRAAGRLKLVNELDEKDMIVFAPKEVKHTITIFTDVDCGYCRKMHQEIAELNKAGIKIRYLAFPRSGVDTPSYYKMVSVWCAKDRNSALTAAKADQPVEKKTCDNPVQKHLEVVKKLGVRGTPALLFENGDLVPGYVPATQLIQALNGEALQE